jgi:hypothetical protein
VLLRGQTIAQVKAATAYGALVEQAMLLDAKLVETITALDEAYRLTGDRGLLIWDASPALCKALRLLAFQLDCRGVSIERRRTGGT